MEIGEIKSQYYTTDYYHERDYKDLYPYLKYILINRAVPNRDFIKERIRILDVGCGIGVYVNFLKSHGYAVYGIDYSAAAVKISKQVQASALSLPFKDNSFDLIISAHLIEHLAPREVKEFLNEITRVLRPKGRVFLLTPNMWSLRRLFTKKECFFKDPTHINMFNPRKIKKLLKDNNFFDMRFSFRLPCFLQYERKEWIIPYTGPFRIIRKHIFFQDILFFLFSATPLGYFRDVIHVLALNGK